MASVLVIRTFRHREFNPAYSSPSHHERGSRQLKREDKQTNQLALLEFDYLEYLR